MIKKLKTTLLILAAALTMGGLVAPAYASAATKCAVGYDHPLGKDNQNTCRQIMKAGDCASGKVDPKDHTKCVMLGNDCQNKDESKALACNQIVKDLNLIVNFLAGLVGIAVVAMIITGGIQYSTARNSPEAIKAARSRITNALVALIVFMLAYGFLQWLIPGGVFTK